MADNHHNVSDRSIPTDTEVVVLQEDNTHLLSSVTDSANSRNSGMNYV